MKQVTMRDYARMCKACTDVAEGCIKCPLYDLTCDSGSCQDAIYEKPDEAEELVRKWCEEHPAKTYFDDFKEKFPDAPGIYDGKVIGICIKAIYGGTQGFECKSGNCAKCWGSEVR